MHHSLTPILAFTLPPSSQGLFSSKVDLSKRADAFSLGSRADILASPDAPPVLVHVAQAEKQKLPFEALFRSVQRHLMDSATSEYGFALEFFGTVLSRTEATETFYKVCTGHTDWWEQQRCGDTRSCAGSGVCWRPECGAGGVGELPVPLL